MSKLEAYWPFIKAVLSGNRHAARRHQSRDCVRKDATVSHVLPELGEKLTARRRGAKKLPVKVAATIRLDADVLEALQASGKGRQTRVNDALRDMVKKAA
ncbi:MAG: BrnA antitoxin family protein [Rhodocyclaceae bacterium]|nr:BrnA antitoxin family protein [Rhodocyclaceae bacterium]